MKYILLFIALFFGQANADVWLDSSNRSAKNDVEFLASRGIINSPITTFPLVWNDIVPQLQDANIKTRSERKAVTRLLTLYKLSAKTKVTARLGSDEYQLPAQPDRQHDKSSVNISTTFGSEKVKAKLNADLVNGDLNGSYISLLQSNFIFYFGAQQQFWGPGSDTSLIFSDLADPIPALGLQRASSDPFTLPILNLLGPWSFKAQIAQLESNRSVPDGKLWSTRFNFKPLQNLEIGLSHAAQWGGEGNGNSLSDLYDVISGKEYCVVPAEQCNSSLLSKFGNQLAGIDIKLNFNINGLDLNLYAQTVGEDAPTDNILPADKVNMFGISAFARPQIGLIKVFFETIDSNLSCGLNTAIKDCFYEHSTYQSGYRYRGIPIGSQYDNDTTSYVFGVNFNNNAHFVEAKLKQLTLNEDSSDFATSDGAGGHYLVSEKTDLTLLEYSHQYDWSETQRVSFELQSKLQGSLPNNDDHIVNVTYQHYF